MEGSPALVLSYGGNFRLPGLEVFTTPDYSLGSIDIHYAILVLDGVVVGTVFVPKEKRR